MEMAENRKTKKEGERENNLKEGLQNQRHERSTVDI
jgi:hypothetical protein